MFLTGKSCPKLCLGETSVPFFVFESVVFFRPHVMVCFSRLIWMVSKVLFLFQSTFDVAFQSTVFFKGKPFFVPKIELPVPKSGMIQPIVPTPSIVETVRRTFTPGRLHRRDLSHPPAWVGDLAATFPEWEVAGDVPKDILPRDILPHYQVQAKSQLTPSNADGAPSGCPHSSLLATLAGAGMRGGG
jgi:hypothetical protein